MKTLAPAVLACLVPLTGCVTKYVAPTGGETASLTMETVDPAVRNLWFYRYPGDFDEYRCSAVPAEGIAILNNVSVASGYADGGKNVKSATTTIPAGQPFRFATQLPTYEPRGGVLHLTWCQPHARFTPEPGRKYVAVQGYEGNSCRMELFLTDEYGQRTALPHEKLPACFDPKNGNGIWGEQIRAEYEHDPSKYR